MKLINGCLEKVSLVRTGPLYCQENQNLLIYSLPLAQTNSTAVAYISEKLHSPLINIHTCRQDYVTWSQSTSKKCLHINRVWPMRDGRFPLLLYFWQATKTQEAQVQRPKLVNLDSLAHFVANYFHQFAWSVNCSFPNCSFSVWLSWKCCRHVLDSQLVHPPFVIFQIVNVTNIAFLSKTLQSPQKQNILHTHIRT